MWQSILCWTILDRIDYSCVIHGFFSTCYENSVLGYLVGLISSWLHSAQTGHLKLLVYIDFLVGLQFLHFVLNAPLKKYCLSILFNKLQTLPIHLLSLICSDIVITVAPEITVSDQLHGVGPGANVTIKVGILCLKFSLNPLTFSLNTETNKKNDRSKKLRKLQNFNSWMMKLINV